MGGRDRFGLKQLPFSMTAVTPAFRMNNTSAWRAYRPMARHGQDYDGAEGHGGDGGRGDRARLVAGWHQAVEEVQHDQNPQL